MVWICFYFYTSKSGKLPLNLFCYTAMLVFFQKWTKPAQLNILGLGVTMICMAYSHKLDFRRAAAADCAGEEK